MEHQQRPQAKQPQYLDRYDAPEDKRSALSAVNGHQNRAPRTEPFQSEALRRWQADSEVSASDRQRESQRPGRQYRDDRDLYEEDNYRIMRPEYHQDSYDRRGLRRHHRRDHSDDESVDSEVEDRQDDYRRRARDRRRDYEHDRRNRDRSADPDPRLRGRDHRNRQGSDDKDIPGRPEEKYTLMKAAKAAMMAGGAEYIRCRAEGGEFGAWNGQKGKRIAIAAVSGSAIGMMRNGRLQNSGKKPYAEAFMTSVYAVDFLKRVLRHTEFGLGAQMEKKDWAQQAEKVRQQQGRSDSRRYSR